MTGRRAGGESHKRVGRGLWTWAVSAGFAAWWVVTGANQHPLRTFDRLRSYDRLGLLLPDWRFFAPEPAQHDFHVLHRVLTADGEQTPWRETSGVAPRSWAQLVWFPSRRQDKAIFDICTELALTLGTTSGNLQHNRAYQLLRDFVDNAIRREYADDRPPTGFQFIIARHTGYDEGPDPDYLFASPFVPMDKASSSSMAVTSDGK